MKWSETRYYVLCLILWQGGGKTKKQARTMATIANGNSRQSGSKSIQKPKIQLKI